MRVGAFLKQSRFQKPVKGALIMVSCVADRIVRRSRVVTGFNGLAIGRVAQVRPQMVCFGRGRLQGDAVESDMLQVR